MSKESLPENSNAFHLLDDDASETESFDLEKTVVVEPETVVVEQEETDVVETETVLTTVQNEERKPRLWSDYITSDEEDEEDEEDEDEEDEEDDEDDERVRPTTPIVVPIIHNDSHFINEKISDTKENQIVETQFFERAAAKCN